MNKRYKIILSNNNFYKEIELTEELQQIKVGTDVDCDVRLRKELFFGKIELSFVKNKDVWTVMCSDNLYLTVGDIRKLVTKNLNHGDILEVKYQDSDNFVFSLDFVIDFNQGRKYERAFDITGKSSVSIGSDKGYNIYICSEYVNGDSIVISRNKAGFALEVRNSSYGVYVNGSKAKTGDKLNNGDFISISDFFFYLKDDKLWSEIRPDMSTNGLTYTDYPEENQYPKFIRNSRVKIVPNSEAIEILDPPEMPEKPKGGIFMRLLPSLGMLVSAAVMAMLGSITMIIFSGISGVMSVVTAVITLKTGNKEYNQGVENREKKYTSYIERKKQEIEGYRREEHAALEEIYISQDVEQQRLKSFSPDLFDRTNQDDDFLCVRLGSGAVPAKRSIKYKRHERMEIADSLQILPEQISKEYKYINNAPIVCDFKKADVIGVVGSEQNRYSIFKNILLDICARHYHTEVRTFLVVEPQHANRVEWMRFLPNLENASTGTRNIVCDDESKNLIFEYLYKELTWREQYKTYQTNLVVFFYDEYGFKSHPISKFVNNSKELGVTFVFFADKKSDIPLGCDFIINAIDDKTGSLITTENRDMASTFTYTTVSDVEFASIVKMLAPIYTEEISLEGTLTKNISLFELLNIIAVDDMDLENRWNTSKVFKSMSAPLGVSKTGVVNLDLHDKAHGPHGLVAGTTGSGKSEILQTYILSMATLYHPYEVGFVIIDFKGGGMVNQFKDLPHLLGAITNIDGKQIDRSLMSIKAELEKRQRLFAEVEVNHIDKYIQKFKAGEAEIPLPHLILIVDEFAELKAEQPEFMKELISAARIGRSLGVHLVLATQKPSGQVNEQIWSNSRFKLCLKVQSQEDSNEVLKSPLAAEIKEAGRAYLQVGNNEIFELFQSAYSGSPERMEDAGSRVNEFTVFDVSLSGKKKPVYVQKRKKEAGNSRTQLEAIVDYVHDYCEEKAIAKLPDICLPPLPEILKYSCPSQKIAIPGVCARLGMYDDPSNQYQGEVSVNLSEDNLMIIGSAQYGKTNVLQTIIRDLAENYSSDQVNIYVLDFGSMVLMNLEKLKHIGGVIVSSEEERVVNLFKMLTRELAQRKERLATEGVSSFVSYLEAGFRDLPQIVLMIDNLTALQQLYANESELLLNLCREGNTVGISVVVANSQTNGIGFKYLSNFAQRIALFCNDSGEYTSLFDRTRIAPDNMPGRVLVDINHQIMEGQIFLAFEGEREIDRVTAMREYVVNINKQNSGGYAKPVPVVPEIVTISSLKAQQPDLCKVSYQIPFGMNYADMHIEYLNLLQNGVLGILGREESGKTNFVLNVLNVIQSNIFTNLTKAYVFDDSRHKLESVNDYGCVETYTTDISVAKSMIEEIHSTLLERKSDISASGANITHALNTEPLLLLVVSGQENISELLQDSKTQERIMSMIKELRKYKVFVILSGLENTTIPYSAPAVLKYIKESKDIIALDDIGNIRFIEIPLKYQKEYAKEIGVGDGYSFIGGKVNKVKTILDK